MQCDNPPQVDATALAHGWTDGFDELQRSATARFGIAHHALLPPRRGIRQ
jgi:hypothetical protein